ncbi:MAG: hypothetical protein H8D84_01210 [Proteobacteria bacterium]|nr:hypothetical protein [Pseudomonadota bacterium]
MSGEENFITQILTQAVEDASYKGTSKKYLKHKVSAIDWIVNYDPEYQNYCKMLGLDPSTIRNKILKNVNITLTKKQNNQIGRAV